MVGSIAIFPPMITATTTRVSSARKSGDRGVLSRRPRLNFNMSTERGNKAMTVSQTSENLKFEVSWEAHADSHRRTSLT